MSSAGRSADPAADRLVGFIRVDSFRGLDVSLGQNSVCCRSANRVTKTVRLNEEEDEVRSSSILPRMFNDPVSCSDLQSTQPYAHTDVVLPVRDDSLLVEERCCSRTISDIDRAEITQGKSRQLA